MRVSLTQGSYVARDIIANAQRCLNLFPEKNPPDAPVPYTHYQTPGLLLRCQLSSAERVRCLYQASSGDLYAVCGPAVFFIDINFNQTPIGFITDALSPCYMADNGKSIMLVDGTANGYTINMQTKAFAQISDPNFLGGSRVDYVDTYFVISQPGSPTFFWSDSNATTFNSLNFAAKTSGSDNLASLVVLNGYIWLIGNLTTEVWADAGAADSAFQRVSGTQKDHGCIAPYSVAKADASVFWLSQDRAGGLLVLQGTGTEVQRVSNHAVEAAWNGYAGGGNATAYTYQVAGHTFYVLSFGSADKTWAYDMATGMWHERASADASGNLHMHRGFVATYAYGQNLVGDVSNGAIYQFNGETENGIAIQRIRAFPHLPETGNRIRHDRFVADVSAGSPVTLNLRWSNDRGASWSSYMQQALNQTGSLTQAQWRRLGLSRDRIYELSWSGQSEVALNGAFLELTEATS